MKSRSFIALALVLPLLLATSACSSWKKKKGGSGYGGNDGDLISGSPLPDRQEGVSFLGDNVDRNKFAPVHFGFDSYTVAPAEQGKIQQVAAFIKSESNNVIVAGFTDERGTPEYNRALGERRAQAVRQALIGAGADAARLQTVSFGSEMPADSGSSESAWAKNRRAEFGVVR
jgi:peptidoglycan-associated lipoprotein